MELTFLRGFREVFASLRGILRSGEGFFSLFFVGEPFFGSFREVNE